MVVKILAPLVISLCSGLALAADLGQNAPPEFDYSEGIKAVPVDFENSTVSFVFDIVNEKVLATADVRFTALGNGYPFLDLVPEPSKVNFQGVEVETGTFKTRSSPQLATKVRVLESAVEAGQSYQLVVEYEIDSMIDSLFGFEEGSVYAALFMDDIMRGGRGFWENYGPSNYEFDQFKLKVFVRVEGASKDHVVYSNGEIQPLVGQNQWSIEFPEYFNASAFYIQLADKGRYIEAQEEVLSVSGKKIPFIIYSKSEQTTATAMTAAKKVFAENEAVYGAYAHANVVAFITPGGGGMEYCGATATSLWALEHEFTHFWFARGVMPVNGNAGWIDEAVASWRDNGYPRATSGPTGAANRLGGFSPFKRETTMDAYTKGATLISQFDRLFSDELGESLNMKKILSSLFQTKQRSTISVEDFKSFLQTITNKDLGEIFKKYVYGESAEAEIPLVDGEKVKNMILYTPESWKQMRSKHPMPYTAAELKAYL